MKWIFLSFITLAFWVALYLYQYLGVSQPVEVSVSEAPVQLLVFRNHLGAYHKINTVIEEIETKLKDNGLSCTKTFGEFFDDPKTVEEDRLNSRGGCLFEGQVADIEVIVKKIIGPDSKDIQIAQLPARKVVLAKFGGSPSIGPFKVYPRIEDTIQTERLGRNGPTLEIYEINGDQVLTTYLQPVK